MKHLTVAAALVLTLAAAGCSDDADPETDTAAPAPAESSAEAESPETSPAPAAPTESAAAGGGENVLTGVVGTEDDPDAFEISLTDSSGAEVETLPAGEYTINVTDLSEIHNFHLTGGDVDETTTVPETGEKTFTVDLTAGDYEAICDPHPNMVTSFTVT
jgi:plastocyanin